MVEMSKGKEGLTMSIQGIHPSKLFVAPFTRKWSIIRMQLLVPLAIVLSCKSFPAARPMTLEWLFLVVRSYMPYGPSSARLGNDKINNTPTFKIKAPSERTPASWNGTHKCSLLLPSLV